VIKIEGAKGMTTKENKIKKIFLGTVQMGLPYGINNSTGQILPQEVEVILKEAYLAGITTLDTAESYGDAHRLIGKFHTRNPDKVFKIITKFPSEDKSIDFEEKVNQYLKDLSVDNLDTIMFHSFKSYQENRNDLKTWLSERVDSKFTHCRIGVSVYLNEEIEMLADDEIVSVIQLPFNLLDNDLLRGDTIRKASAKSKIIHTRSAFLQGLFFKEVDDTNGVVKRLKVQLTEIRKIASDYKINLRDLALNYCLAQGYIDSVIVGVDSVDQLSNNLNSLQADVSVELVERINRIRIDDIELLNPALWKKFY
jgi:aryl-alcohol dehydrogenase-like predicted oxidoreductase